ncbi:MAG: dihydroneopterin aldolase [Pseudomonadota bacterium]
MDTMLAKNDISTDAIISVETKRTVFLKGLAIDAEIGAYADEIGRKQPIKIDVSMNVTTPDNPLSENLSDVVCYDRMSQSIEALISQGHIKFVETLATQIAELALVNPMVLSVTVRIEKLEAISIADAVGVEITRRRKS